HIRCDSHEMITVARAIFLELLDGLELKHTGPARAGRVAGDTAAALQDLPYHLQIRASNICPSQQRDGGIKRRKLSLNPRLVFELALAKVKIGRSKQPLLAEQGGCEELGGPVGHQHIVAGKLVYEILLEVGRRPVQIVINVELVEILALSSCGLQALLVGAI